MFCRVRSLWFRIKIPPRDSPILKQKKFQWSSQLESHADLFVSLLRKVVLYDVSGSILGAQTLGAEHTSHTFTALVPGRLYRAEVITHSGDLTNNVSAFGRTCEWNENTHKHIFLM